MSIQSVLHFYPGGKLSYSIPRDSLIHKRIMSNNFSESYRQSLADELCKTILEGNSEHLQQLVDWGVMPSPIYMEDAIKQKNMKMIEIIYFNTISIIDDWINYIGMFGNIKVFNFFLDTGYIHDEMQYRKLFITTSEFGNLELLEYILYKMEYNPPQHIIQCTVNMLEVKFIFKKDPKIYKMIKWFMEHDINFNKKCQDEIKLYETTQEMQKMTVN